LTAKPVSIFTNRAYTRMFSAYALSSFGDYFDFIAMMLLVGYVWHLSPIVLALFPIMYALPGMLFGQFTGVLADRANKLKIMIICDLLRAVLTVALIFSPNAWVAYVLLFARGTAGVFNSPANQALTRQVVAEEHLLKATTYNSSVFQFSKIFGPFLGGTIAAATTPSICLVVNAVSFVVSALILLTLSQTVEVRQTESKRTKKAPFFEMWREGWKALFSNRLVFSCTLFYLITMCVMQIVESQYTTLFRDLAPDRMELRGWFTSSIGLGSFASVMTLNRMNHLKKPGIVLGIGALLVGVMYVFVGRFTPQTSSFWPLLGGCIGGIGAGITMSGFMYLVQSKTPKEAMGRVFGILMTLFNMIVIIGPLLGGSIIMTTGAGIVFQITGVIMIVIGAVGYLFQNVIWREVPASVSSDSASTHA
jgi:MFS family permease